MKTGLWRYLCPFSSLAAALLSVNVGLLVLLGISFLFAGPEWEARTAAILSLVVLGSSSLFFLALVLGCRRKPPEALSGPSQGWEETKQE